LAVAHVIYLQIIVDVQRVLLIEKQHQHWQTCWTLLYMKCSRKYTKAENSVKCAVHRHWSSLDTVLLWNWFDWLCVAHSDAVDNVVWL